MIQNLTVQLFNASAGSITLQNQPRGLDEFTITRKRGEGDGFVFEFSINLDFNKEAAEYISAVYSSQGVDGIIAINIYAFNANTYKNEVEYQGQLQLDNYTQGETSVTTNVEPIGFQRKFLNLQDYNVALDNNTSRLNTPIGAAPVTNLSLLPKTIRRQAVLRGQGNAIESGFTPGFYSYIRFGGPGSQSDFDDTILSSSTWTTPGDINEDVITVDDYILQVNEPGPYSLDFNAINFDLYIDVSKLFPSLAPNLESWTVQLKYQRNDGAPITVYDQTFGVNDFDSVIDTPDNEASRTRFIKLNQSASGFIVGNFDITDKIYVWFESSIDFIGQGTSLKNIAYTLREGSSFKITGDTLFPATSCNGYMVYEFLEHIVKTITDQEDVFRSEFFGRTDSTFIYPQDGEGALLFITNGVFIRQLDNRSLFASFKDAFESLNAIFCLGWGFETLENGQQILRCESKDYFYDKDITAIEVDKIEDLEFFVDTEFLYSNVICGYPEIENINQVNGVDEFNTELVFASPLTNVSQELDIRSEYRASGFEIESQRRLIDSTDESRLDDKIFVIVVKRDGNSFAVEQGSDFASVANVLDPDTAYNVRISPARNIRRWSKILASSILRSQNKTFAFTSGEGNYLMRSQLAGESVVAENGNITLENSQALFYPEKYRMNIEYPRSRRTIVDNNIRGVFKSQDWKGGDFEGFFTEIQANIPNQSASITILRVYR